MQARAKEGLHICVPWKYEQLDRQAEVHCDDGGRGDRTEDECVVGGVCIRVIGEAPSRQRNL